MSELDRYLDDLGARLDTARVRPRPRGQLVAWIATGAVALAVASTLSLAGGGSGEHRGVPGVGPVDAIAKARAALQVPAGEMLHMRVRIGGSAVEELWATPDPLRWRQVDGSPGAGEQQFAYGGGVYSMFDARANRLERVTGYTDDSPQARTRTILGVGGSTNAPSDDLRAALDRGALVDAGEVQVGGRTVRRLETRGKDDPRTLIVLIYDVDPVTFAPVGGERIYYRPPRTEGGPRRAGPAPIRFTVETYQRVPIDKAQLTITPGPRTTVVDLNRAQWMGRFRAVQRWERRCAKLRRSDPRADCGAQPPAP
jgi:hypothetical protein